MTLTLLVLAIPDGVNLEGLSMDLAELIKTYGGSAGSSNYTKEALAHQSLGVPLGLEKNNLGQYIPTISALRINVDR